MKAFILAAGEGTRMRPLTARTPKPLLPVAGKPILSHLIESLQGVVDEVIVLVGWQAKRIKDTLDTEELDVDIKYVRQEELLGTAHAISKAEKHIDDGFICMNGDVVIPSEVLHSFAEKFNEENVNLLGMAEVDKPESYGVIAKEGEEVRDIVEKPKEPPTNLINAGIYGFRTEIFDAIRKTEKSPRGEYEITDSLNSFMDDGRLKGFEISKDDWIELSRPWDLLQANQQILSDTSFPELREGEVQENVHLEGSVSIAEGVLVKEGSYIKGPVCIGADAEIGPNCLIRGCTSIGEGCKVGAAVEIKNSIIMTGTNVPHHNYIGDSVLGRNCNLGSGTKVANLRLDEKEITVTHRGEKVETGMRKLGVIMGDGVKTGINSMLNTGTIIGEDTFIGPGALAAGEIGPESRVQ